MFMSNDGRQWLVIDGLAWSRVGYTLGAVLLVLSKEKKLSVTALSQTFPDRRCETQRTWAGNDQSRDEDDRGVNQPWLWPNKVPRDEGENGKDLTVGTK